MGWLGGRHALRPAMATAAVEALMHVEMAGFVSAQTITPFQAAGGNRPVTILVIMEKVG